MCGIFLWAPRFDLLHTGKEDRLSVCHRLNSVSVLGFRVFAKDDNVPSYAFARKAGDDGCLVVHVDVCDWIAVLYNQLRCWFLGLCARSKRIVDGFGKMQNRFGVWSCMRYKVWRKETKPHGNVILAVMCNLRKLY